MPHSVSSGTRHDLSPFSNWQRAGAEADCAVMSDFFFSSRRRHTRSTRDWSSDVCSSDLRDVYGVPDLEGQLRNTIVARMTDSFAQSSVPFLDMAANQAALGQKIVETVKPSFAELGLSLENFVVENLSLPDELQKMLDQRISMNMIGDMGKYTQFQVAQSLPIAAANEGGGGIAGIGVGLGAGLTMAQSVMNAMKPGEQA